MIRFITPHCDLMTSKMLLPGILNWLQAFLGSFFSTVLISDWNSVRSSPHYAIVSSVFLYFFCLSDTTFIEHHLCMCYLTETWD